MLMASQNSLKVMKYIQLFLLLMICNVTLFGQYSYYDYDKICYCSGRETPHSIVSYDNNLQLLLELRIGLSKKELDSINIPYTNSQLKLLLLFNLIEKKKNIYYTSIPILDTTQTILLRKQSKLIADNIFPHIEKDIENLALYLKKSYNSRNEFAIIFSYVLDGLIWNDFEEKGLVTPRESDDNISPWTGHFWMIANPRESKCGTNTSSESNATIYVTNGVPWRFMKPLYNDYELTKVMLNNISDDGKLSDTIVQNSFGMYNLFNEHGEVLVPIIYENDQNELYLLARKISKKICDQFITVTSIPSLVNKYNFKNSEEALIVLYHETMWELLSSLEEKEIIVKPEIFNSPDNAKMQDMTDLIFFVVKD